RHVGVITDGNRRWAREFGATTADGHRAGAAKIVEFLGWGSEIDVAIVTLYVLSKENLARSAAEVSMLIAIISDLVAKIAATDGYGRRRGSVSALSAGRRARHDDGRELDTITAELPADQLGERLYTKGRPDPDRIIRAAVQQRLSGFLMWQSAYSEFYCCEA